MKKTVRIEVSARHCHLSQRHLDKLFGKGYKLKKMKDLSQKGQYASKERITLKTADAQIDNLRILGPVRKETQVELAMTDARKLNIKLPVRVSGFIEDTPGATLVGPKGTVILKKGIIIAKRHIHCNPAQAKEMGLKKGEHVSVLTHGDRSVTFHDVVIRIDKKFDLSFQIDTDEGNASLPDGVCSRGEIIKK